MELLKIVKKTSGLGELVIKPIEKRIAKELIVKNHYSHKWNDGGFGKYNFGIFKSSDEENCLGVAVYGYLKNPNARLFEHPNEKAWMSELNRMWISDELGKNAETVLIGASLKLIKKMDKDVVAVQSFADGRLGCGTIYKASNFKYFGYHNTLFLRNKRTGEVVHQQIFTNSTSTTGYLRANISYLLGDFETFSVKTYRYIYPLCKHFKFIKSKEQTYPEYEKGETPTQWVRNTTLIKDRCVKMVYELVSK
ncbi:hypothetical protein [Sphingobacterium sp. FBM7-1]|uniref:Mom family adenine methylcarbamoylation protein n=1 Tax=Sphingobacterium sp. FBM7-1 TaxID=2886688 RepID=UPI001D10B647|nr:hypothetical protein [Sphingobacterium sp. FBM7-1]MCC2598056.1 hypothetical protein [Sphingobacterium sp. FBM7-1]